MTSIYTGGGRVRQALVQGFKLTHYLEQPCKVPIIYSNCIDGDVEAQRK